MKTFNFLKKIKYEKIEDNLSQTEIETFEKTNNISLPEDYKYFLMHIGNGVRITMPNGKERIVNGIKRPNLYNHNKLLSQPFIFDKAFLHTENQDPVEWFKDCINPELDDEEICSKCRHFDKCPFAYADSLDIDSMPYYSGVISICHAGCTYQYCLVLTGNHFGEIWMDNELRDFIPSKRTFAEFIKWVATSKFY